MSTEMGTADWTSWRDAIRAGVDAVGDDLLADIARWLARASIVIIAGNGGSSTLASHMAQAIAKPSYGPTAPLSPRTPTMAGGRGRSLLVRRPTWRSLAQCSWCFRRVVGAGTS